MINVLVMSSAPIDQGQLQLGREYKVIKHSLDSSRNRDEFKIIHNPATTIDDLRRYMVEYSPSIVHFAGHGAGQPGLCFEDDNGFTHTARGEQLAKLFHIFSDSVKCVVLNACLSEMQAVAIGEHVDFVVGMREEIGDLAAQKFAQGFYEGIWGGVSYEKAFKLGCSAIDTSHIPEEHIPKLLKSPRLGGSALIYSEETQKMENFILRYLNSTRDERVKLRIPQEIITHEKETDKIEYKQIANPSVTVQSTKTVAGDYKEVQIILRRGLETHDQTVFLKPHGDSYLLDLAATIGYWPIPYVTFMALGVNEPITVRVKAQLASYFNYDFTPERYLSLRLWDVNGNTFHGYVGRSLPIASRIVSLLFDGSKHSITITIYPSQRDTGHVYITDFISDSWVIPLAPDKSLSSIQQSSTVK